MPNSEKKRKRKQAEEEEAHYEKKPRTGQTKQDHNERILLPIKSKDSIIQRKQKIALTGMYRLYVCVNNVCSCLKICIL